MTIASSKPASRVGGIVFGGIFFLFGFGFFIAFVGSAIIDRIAMQAWQPVQITLTDVKLQRNYSDGSSTYKATASYVFDFQGQNFEGNRVSLHSGSDNIGSYQQDINSRLQNAMKAGRQVSAWVNPSNPTESVIDRSVRWSMIIFPGMLCSVFMIIGGTFIFFSWKRGPQTSPSSNANKPWLAKEEWSPTGINSDNKLMLGVWWFGVLFVHALSTPILFQMPKALSRGEYGILIGLIFVALGFFLIFKAIQKTIEQLRFGRVPVVLNPFPGEIGGLVAGYLDFQQRLDQSSKFNLYLKQMRTNVRRSGGKTTISTSSIWELIGKGTLKRGINGSRVHFAFEVPDTMEESRTDSGSGYWWSLVVSGDMPGINFKRSYEIPVFKTGNVVNGLAAGMPRYGDQPKDVEVAKSQVDFTEQLESIIDIQHVDGGLLIKQAPGKQKMAIPLTVFGLIFGGAGIGSSFMGAPLLFPIVFSAFALLICSIGIGMLITGYETYIGKKQVSHEIFRLGKRRKKITWLKNNLRGFALQQTGSSSGGSTTTEYFSLLLQDEAGEKITLSAGIEGRQAAHQLLESLNILTGIRINEEVKSRLQIRRERLGR